MKMHLKIVVIAFFVILGTVFFVLPGQTVFGKKSAATGTNAVSPRELYQRNCARCHGADGKGDTEAGRTYEVPNLTESSIRGKSVAKLAKSISKGGGGMPAFGKKLKAAEINALAAYTRTLR